MFEADSSLLDPYVTYYLVKHISLHFATQQKNFLQKKASVSICGKSCHRLVSPTLSDTKCIKITFAIESTQHFFWFNNLSEKDMAAGGRPCGCHARLTSVTGFWSCVADGNSASSGTGKPTSMRFESSLSPLATSFS